jgi:hypothetical protein
MASHAPISARRTARSQELARLMEEAGMSASIDAVGNAVGRYAARPDGGGSSFGLMRCNCSEAIKQAGAHFFRRASMRERCPRGSASSKPLA